MSIIVTEGRSLLYIHGNFGPTDAAKAFRVTLCRALKVRGCGDVVVRTPAKVPRSPPCHVMSRSWGSWVPSVASHPFGTLLVYFGDARFRRFVALFWDGDFENFAVGT